MNYERLLGLLVCLFFGNNCLIIRYLPLINPSKLWAYPSLDKCNFDIFFSRWFVYCWWTGLWEQARVWSYCKGYRQCFWGICRCSRQCACNWRKWLCPGVRFGLLQCICLWSLDIWHCSAEINCSWQWHRYYFKMIISLISDINYLTQY